MHTDTMQKLCVFIVPDGNRRWAGNRGLQSWEGHQQGYLALRKLLERVWDFGVTHLVFWALSQDNIRKRTKDEIAFLFSLLGAGIEDLASSKDFAERQIKFQAVGKWRKQLPSELVEKLERLIRETASRTGPVFTLLIAYDGVEDIFEAVDVTWGRDARMRQHTPEEFHGYLMSSCVPDIDLYVRTGGEPHLSAGALMWQMRNAHLHFTRTLWPDFSPVELQLAIEEFKNRTRRFGA